MEAMVDAAVHIGFPRDMAVKLVTTTIRGSASFAMQSEDTIGMLRNKVWRDEKVYYFVSFLLTSACMYVCVCVLVCVAGDVPRGHHC
jgi:Pyrroline-5-carboxylate reductase dimerisation